MTVNKPIRSLQLFQLIRFLTLLAIGIAMVKMGLTRKEIGIYESVLFVSSLLSTFWITGLIQALLPLYPGEANKSRNIFFTVFIAICAIALAAVILAASLHKSVMGFAGINNPVIFYQTLAYLAIGTPTVLAEYIYFLKEKYKLMLIYGATSHLLQVGFIILPILTGFDIFMSINGLIAISALRFIWLVGLIFKNSEITINITFLKRYLTDGLSLSLKFLISTSGLYIDQLIIGAYFNASTFAVYRFGAREIPVVNIISASTSNALLSHFGKAEGIGITLAMLKDESQKLMHAIFPISILAIVVSPWLFPVVFSNDFIDSAGVFMIYCLLVVSRAMFPQTVAQGLRKNRAVLLISIIEMLLNVLLSLILIRPFGIFGVAAATTIVYTLEKVLLIVYNNIYLKISPTRYIPIKLLFFYTTITLAAFILAWFYIPS